MAKIEKDDDGDDIINVNEKVGVRGINAATDVLVVQAMLNYMTQFSFKWSKGPVPEPNGCLDKSTQRAIFDYQKHVHGHNANFWIGIDGSVSSYKKGVKLLKKQEWTIISMNMDCGVLAAALGEGNHIDALCNRWLAVAVALGRNPLAI